jgi:intracellular multiplication protein IcmX
MKKLSRLLSGAACALLMAAPSLGVESPALLQAVVEIKADIEKILANAGTPDFGALDAAVQAYVAGLTQQPALNNSETQASLPAINMQEYAQTLTQQQIKNILTTVDDTGGETCQKGACLDARTVSSTFINSGITNIYRDMSEAKKVNPDDQMLNMDTLLGPLTYKNPSKEQSGISPGSSSNPTTDQKDQKLYARYFIQIVSGLSDPVRLLTPLDYENKLKNDEDRKDYLSRLQAFTALVSVGMNNLYQMYVERLPIASNQPSLAETEAQMAARRMTPEWRKMIESASPVTLARENLYLQAEINYQLYRSRQQQERILATLSVLQLQNLQVMVKTGVAPPLNKPPATPGVPTAKNITPGSVAADYGNGG